MTVTATPIFPQTITNKVTQFTSSYTINTITTVYSGGTNGSKVETFIATNTDSTNTQVLQIYLVISSVNYLIGSISVPLSSGNTIAAPAINVLTALTGLPKDSNGNPYLYLASGTVLSCSIGIQPASAKLFNMITAGGDY
jgi:hypothetical protein